MRALYLTLALVPPAAQGCSSAATTNAAPNILIILADDLGYGDLAVYNPASKVPTPNLDALAAGGLRFTDAHSPSTVCTPTRYSIMTGAMCFRSGQTRVFSGVGGPSLIKDEQLTLPELLKGSGYRTALFGKWHIGMTFYDDQGQPIHKGGREPVERIDYSRPIDGGPIDHGFDQFFGTVCCPTTGWLYAYIDGRRIPVPPTGIIDKALYPKNPYTNDFRPGLAAPDFDASRVDMVFLEKSRRFLEEHKASSPDRPFFLLHSMQAVHLPSIPAKEFRGSTDAGPHGDFIHQMDWTVGQLLQTLDELELTENTLVVFCSDNGPEVPTVIHMRKDHGHDGARPWRGVKRDQWEGGHRTPLLMKWPGLITPGRVTDELTSLTDLFATCASIIGSPLPNDAAADSYDMLPVLLDQQGPEPIRPYMLQQTWVHKFAIRVGQWKYLDHKGSAGSNYDQEGDWGMAQYALPDTAPDAPGQLYDLEADPGETTNLSGTHPGIVKKLKETLDASIASGRSAPTR